MYAPCTDARSNVHTWHRTCAACTLFLPVRLTPSFHGSMARCLGFAPIYSGFSTPLRSVSRPFAPSCPSLPSSSPPCPFFVLCPLRKTICLTSLVRSFVRSCYSWPRAPRRFGDFNARQLLFSRLPLRPRFLSLFRSRPHPLAPLFSAARPFPVPIRRVSTVNRYFRSDAFPLSIAPILLASACDRLGSARLLCCPLLL